ncbi:MAG: hypothetical protein QOG89_3740 [Thermomicrobiales bacterium]|nr:hypothetical protein [Thermomicrobiales bacterium]
MSSRSPSRSATPAPAEESPLARSLTRFEPRDGLVIDAETWQVAHTYHVESGRGHNLAAHGAGILVGLEVIPVGGTSLGVLPGVGIDPLGRFLVVPSPTRVTVEESGSLTGIAYVVLQQPQGSADADGRVKDESVVQVVGTPPEEPYLELARVKLTGKSSIGYAEDPLDPRPGEVDVRYRLSAGGHARGDVAVAEVVLPDAGDAHVGVAALLARAIGLDGAYRARYLGPVQVGDHLPDATILYASGNREFAATDGVVNWLKSFLDGGGTLVGDGCHATPADPFGGAFDKLSRSVNRQMKRIVGGDRLLWAHHLFGAPPPGLTKTDAGMILAGGGVVYCASDYGCVLSGVGEPPPSRPAIRAVEEFATNLAATARERAFARTFLE